MRCQRGFKCIYYHQESEKRQIDTPIEEYLVEHSLRHPGIDFKFNQEKASNIIIDNPQSYKKKVCYDYQKQQCWRGVSCHFYHEKEEQRPYDMPIEEYIIGHYERNPNVNYTVVDDGFETQSQGPATGVIRERVPVVSREVGRGRGRGRGQYQSPNKRGRGGKYAQEKNDERLAA